MEVQDGSTQSSKEVPEKEWRRRRPEEEGANREASKETMRRFRGRGEAGAITEPGKRAVRRKAVTVLEAPVLRERSSEDCAGCSNEAGSVASTGTAWEKCESRGRFRSFKCR